VLGDPLPLIGAAYLAKFQGQRIVPGLKPQESLNEPFVFHGVKLLKNENRSGLVATLLANALICEGVV
jgi:hypothetical protein